MTGYSEVFHSTMGWLAANDYALPWRHVSVCRAPPAWSYSGDCFVLVIDPEGAKVSDSAEERAGLLVELVDATGLVVEIASIVVDALADSWNVELIVQARETGTVLYGEPLALLAGR